MRSRAGFLLLVPGLCLLAGAAALHYFESSLEGNATIAELYTRQDLNALHAKRGDELSIPAIVQHRQQVTRAGGTAYLLTLEDGTANMTLGVSASDFEANPEGHRVAARFAWDAPSAHYAPDGLAFALPRWPVLVGYLAGGPLAAAGLLLLGATKKVAPEPPEEHEVGFERVSK